MLVSVFFVIQNVGYIFSVIFSGQAIPPQLANSSIRKKKDLHNHMYNPATKLRLSKLDQENLALKIEEWKTQYPDDEIVLEDTQNWLKMKHEL